MYMDSGKKWTSTFNKMYIVCSAAKSFQSLLGLVAVLVVCCLLDSATVAYGCSSPGGRQAEAVRSSADPPHTEVNVSVELTNAVVEVSDQFLSVTLDAEQIRHNWGKMNFTLPRVINMAKGLSPAMLRVGGASGDFLIFQNQSQQTELEDGKPAIGDGLPRANTTNFTMSRQQWDEVNQFAEAVSWDMIFGLNILLRHPWPNGSWDSSNAEQLMKYTESQGYKVNWELGNEPNLLPEKAPNIPVSPEQDAIDHQTLKALADRLSPGTKFLVGPDTTHTAWDYFSSFLQAVGNGVINAATWHDYYIDCLTAKLPEDFHNVTILDSLIDLALTARYYVSKYRLDAELWFGETSSCIKAYSSSVPSTYVAGFMWLDKLAIAALTNHTRVFRQAIFGSPQSLLDNDLFPRPDYWLSLLYKSLVGRKVLYVTDSIQPGRFVRVYCHCALPPYKSGSVVLLLLNLNTVKATATLMNKELALSSRDVYWLTPPGGSTNITSLEVTLNGKLLKLADDSIPPLEPLQQEASSVLTLPPLSFGFYVFKDVQASACI